MAMGSIRLGIITLTLIWSCAAYAQTQGSPEASQASQESLKEQVKELRQMVLQLSRQVAGLEAERQASLPGPTASASTAASIPAPSEQPTQQAPNTQPATPSEPVSAGLLAGTTLNLTLDGYYEYNFNSPVGRVNLLRAYDVSSNSFSLNQATVVLDRAPDLTQGRRFGARLDLQYGQATETLQGNPANELRPQVYRAVFQAYGTYIFPLGKGLTIDFGKWASQLGIEGNYTKDQMNYSRSFLFNFLPFYHMGVRASYDLTPKVNLAYWLVNGAQQTEDFNGFKSQAFIFTLKPVSTVTWNVNYYFGQEQPDVVPVLHPGLPTEATQPGLPTTPIVPTPNGREHIFDTYATWNATPKLVFAGEGDYVINRVFAGSPPKHVSAGDAYALYQLTPRLDFAGRAEYFSDRGGLFSGVTQALKETTLTTTYKLTDGFQVMTEWRRDFSNQPFFLTPSPGVLKKDQSTATIGLIWWWGGKQGSW